MSPFVEIEIVGLDCDNNKFKTVTIRKYSLDFVSFFSRSVKNLVRNGTAISDTLSCIMIFSICEWPILQSYMKACATYL